MQVLITGATGLLGRALSDALLGRGDTVIGVSRSVPANAAAQIEWITWNELDDGVARCDAIMHLAGAGIADKRWTAARKQELRDSRIRTGQQLTDAVRRTETPRVVVTASAVGFYGPRADVAIDEDALPGNDFLAILCRDWETAGQSDIRTVALRFGVILSTEGGALAKMVGPFKLGIGGPVGRGKQGFSWIHFADAVGLVLFAIDQDAIHGAVNATAPTPVTNREFSRALGSALHRPAFIPVPPVLLRIPLGDGASVLTTGQRVIPTRALAAGYAFQFSDIDAALADLVGDSALTPSA